MLRSADSKANTLWQAHLSEVRVELTLSISHSTFMPSAVKFAFLSMQMKLPSRLRQVQAKSMLMGPDRKANAMV